MEVVAAPREYTLRDAIVKSNLERGLITDIRLLIHDPSRNRVTDAVLHPLAQGINAIVWNSEAIEVLGDAGSLGATADVAWDDERRPAVVFASDDGPGSLCRAQAHHPRWIVTTLRMSIFYPNGTTRETAVCGQDVAAIAWTDATVEALAHALLSPERAAHTLDLWQGAKSWRERPTFLQFKIDDRPNDESFVVKASCAYHLCRNR